MSEIFLRTCALIGESGLEKLKNSSVAVFGLGGVGSFACEALARSGIGTLYIYDNATVSESNCNRQLIADLKSIGKDKTDAEKERILSIYPEINIISSKVFLTDKTSLPFEKFDFMLDAVDNVTVKLFLAQKSKELGIPLISVMGTGNKLCPERLRISDIYETKVCPLCRVMRNELKKRGVDRLTAVWSDEKPIDLKEPSGFRENGRPTPASMIFVPASAGILSASFVVRSLLNENLR